jgi:hypothetical protein
MTEAETRTQLATARGIGLMEAYRAAAAETGIDVAVLLGKDSRESRLTLALGPDCRGDGGNGYGISQIDRRFFPAFTSRVGPCNHRQYIRKGAEILRSEIDALGSVKAGLAAYNAGTEAVRTALQQGRAPDSVTTGRNYAADVLGRAKDFRQVLSTTRSAGAGAIAVGAFALLIATTQT